MTILSPTPPDHIFIFYFNILHSSRIFFRDRFSTLLGALLLVIKEARKPTKRGGGVGGGCSPPTHRRQGRISRLPKGSPVSGPGFFLCFSWFFIVVLGCPFSSNKASAAEGFLLVFHRIALLFQDFPSPPTCLDLPRLA